MITMRNHNYCGKLCGTRGKPICKYEVWIKIARGSVVRHTRDNCGSKMRVIRRVKDNWDGIVAPGVVSRDLPQVFASGLVGLCWWYGVLLRDSGMK